MNARQLESFPTVADLLQELERQETCYLSRLVPAAAVTLTENWRLLVSGLALDLTCESEADLAAATLSPATQYADLEPHLLVANVNCRLYHLLASASLAIVSTCLPSACRNIDFSSRRR